jgi:hypothetical protein
MPADRIAAAKKAALTRKRKAAGKKAAATKIRRAAGRKAALTRKLEKDRIATRGLLPQGKYCEQ